MIGAQPRLPRQIGETVSRPGIALDCSNSTRHSGYRAWRIIIAPSNAIVKQTYCLRSQTNAQLLPVDVLNSHRAGANLSKYRRQPAHGRDAYLSKRRFVNRGSAFRSDSLEVIFLELEGNAAVSRGVFVSALEFLARVA